VIFTGTGCTAAVSHMLHLLTYSPEWLETVPAFPPLVIVGPYEHHSNLLPWRESGARVVSIREAVGGGVDMDNLKQVLEANAACPIKVMHRAACSFDGAHREINSSVTATSLKNACACYEP
jgi:selenocysteine lyase/cysteine desulfurase